MIVYKYDTETKEFIQELEINEAYGTNLPFATTVKPLARKEGFAVCFNDTEWEYIEDNRNIVVYNKEKKQESRIDYLGAIKYDVTTSKPGQFDKWDYTTNSWVEDKVTFEDNRKAEINKETSAYILSFYPVEKQVSAELGIYDGDYKAAMINFIDRCVILSDNAVSNGTSIEEYRNLIKEVK